MATEEGEGDDVEIHLQRVSANVIGELTISVPLFLCKKGADRGIRKVVKSSSTAKIERLIGTFQEWPQLLDPALEHLIQPFVTAFVHYVQNHARRYRQADPKKPVHPLPRAICKILYTFCKVRGPKVISRFFRNEPDILEPMLDAFDRWNGPAEGANPSEQMIWEEKYIMLLWLSHLALTPFDLEAISTPAVGTTTISLPTTFFSSPPVLPNVAHRLVALALRYLSSASKERDAAVSLLVRLSLRPDMQHLQLHHRLLQWVFSSPNDPVDNTAHASIYFYTGIFSYLAGFLRSGDGKTVAPFLIPIFQCIQAIITNHVATANGFLGSAVARKLVIKIYRPLAVHYLSASAYSNFNALITSGISQIDDSDLLDSIFDHLLTSLGDKDSPVRLTASKALSVIAQKLDPDMTAQLVDDIVRRQQENTVYEGSGDSGKEYNVLSMDSTAAPRDSSPADPSASHGLVLTLSHLLYRRSAPPAYLSTLIELLIDALDFEQRSPMGTSLGGNVRDAACFGIWSIARKYSTAELLSIHTTNPQSKVEIRSLNSVIELLAAKLVLTATLDPEGNIRRGASAALQELVGRHPDMVPDGIQLIQIVDYHAVGLRSRAMNDVSLQAVVLDKIYLDAIAKGIPSWRAINSTVSAVRRDAAVILGHLVGNHDVHPGMLPLCRRSETVDRSKNPQRKREKSGDEWHGIYLAHAAITREGWFEESLLVHRPDPVDHHLLLKENGIFGPEDIKSHGRGAASELAIEALCTMIAAVSGQSEPYVTLSQLKYHMNILEACFKHCTGQTLNVVNIAAVSAIRLLEEPVQLTLIGGWLKDIKEGRNGQLRSGGSNVALVTVVGAALQSLGTYHVTEDFITLQFDVLVSQLRIECNVGTKCAILNHLFIPVFNRACSDYPQQKDDLKKPLIDSLNDHTIDSRGDIGSEVRIAAINILSETTAPSQWNSIFYNEAFGIVYGLAVEKLDKVRACAWSCIRKVRLPTQDADLHASYTTDSVEYFTFIFDLAARECLIEPMLKGFITSASVGTEVLVRNSRIALLQCLNNSSPNEIDLVHGALTKIILSAIPNGRLLRPSLEVLSFLLDSIVVSQRTDLYEGLLQPLTTVHANTDLPTLQAVIRLAAAGAIHMAISNDRLKELDLGIEKSSLRDSVQRVLKEIKAA
ncbi:MAG: hypothetical protein Q9221_005866 [Calogaya cf. arnoldii]